ncbi:MAG: KH domain-containing protein [Acidobacteriaceae bacterium]
MTHEEKLDSVEDLMTEIVKGLVDHPDAVDVEAVEEDEAYDAEEGVLLELRVAPEDLGKVIGKQGRTVRSMRTILNAVGTKHHQRYTLDVIEDEEDDDLEDEGAVQTPAVVASVEHPGDDSSGE